MTPDDMRACLAALGWSQRQLGRYLGCGERLARSWASGAVPVPDNISIWLRRLARAHNDFPYPRGWVKS